MKRREPKTIIMSEAMYKEYVAYRINELTQQILSVFEGHDMDKVLTEMSNLRKDQTGLPVNIWVDETGSYKKGKHGPRIKFQNDTNNVVNKGNFLTMTISDRPRIPNDEYEQALHGVGSQIIYLLTQFVIKYQKQLLHICSPDNFDGKDYLVNAIRQNQQYADSRYQIAAPDDFRTRRIYDTQAKLFNFLNNHNQLLSPNQWFDSVSKFYRHPRLNQTCSTVTVNGQQMLLTLQGKLIDNQ